MKDELISFETAKLAKEKGFIGTNNTTDYVPMYIESILIEGQGEDDCRDGYYLAPTQSLLQRWLREKHEIHVELCVDVYDDLETMCFRGFNILNMKEYDSLDSSNNDCFKIYEQALEAGLQEALKLIKQ